MKRLTRMISVLPGKGGKKMADGLKWISCDEREPEKYELVIVLIYGHDVIIQQDGETLEDAIRRTMNKCHTSCGYLGGEGWCDPEGYPMIIKPSYWMKIPDPPERRFE